MNALLCTNAGTCPTGDDPLTGAATDPIFGFQKNEKQTVYCAATVSVDR